ncbi:4Fe-4S dicluster domain-containing protein [Desulfotomaculum arcticum]|uniref:4Fe-4S dicluster domain-containing protein n=1 Tax=Desulfotruncus arcticus DSM 17038 TaxID=1121424 RepID=A0A1I2Q6L3_9FIRM|nr:4Fe-4S double cluster binding domain-containing protein [Desulfotruncus arcticus]SFG24105.1 4Fe-4S dicluster domain-containing protein [Desulfotomaculum arcticum] [Desulfotruncus arcticus DSM 17038]
MAKVWLRELTAENLKNLIIKLGGTLVGFGDVSVGLANELQHLSCAISIAIKHSPVEVIKTPKILAYSNQLIGVDKKLKLIQKTVVSILKSYGYKSLAIPPDSMRDDNRFIAKLYPLFPHKTAATCSGLGWVGKSGLLINEHYGPRLSWATVLTDAPLKVSDKPYLTSKCGNCKKCINICPVEAINDWKWVRGLIRPNLNYSLCREHLERNKQVLGKAICGLCIMVCPRGRDNIKEASTWQL